MGFRENNYINIPYPVLNRTDLSDKAKLLYGLIAGFWDNTFKASNEWIATVLGTTPRTVQRTLKELKKKNLITVTIITEGGYVKGKLIIIKKR